MTEYNGEDTEFSLQGDFWNPASEDEIEEEGEYDELTAEDVSGVVTYTLDWSVHSLLERIGNNFDINPAFQRRDAWNGPRKSLYIESLMLGLPVPQIVLAEDKQKGRFIVLDGKQRLVTMKQFADPDEHFKPLRLGKLQFLEDLKGKTFAKIQADPDQREWADNLLSQPVRTIVVRNWSKPAVLYQVFVRLNQYSVPLSPQELRQALFPGEFTVWINQRSIESEAIRKARRLKAPDFRMRDAEMLLRTIAFFDRLEEYAGNLREFLDDACESGNREWQLRGDQFQAMAAACDAAINKTLTAFGPKQAFFRYDATAGYISRFNVAVYDLMCAVFAESILTQELVSQNATKLRQAFEELCSNDPVFQDSIKSTTKTEVAVAGRIIRYGTKVQEITGVQLPVIGRASQLLEARK
ncbi:hypothetical protein Sru01_40750 [Sphaerisporangium rufum]|uniref:GmrSD restriction endonucleases N-terminal domain-containing protein n=1 Tax=Sphaerisporangium rufum TaxID=1381558 RepID=A0A919V2L2_9ACTN|nr:DUF262 domain-containing protein [Sphaerisporangium rufum]GII79093.1 hypothetical protein Sru01_40750 [Sphaerisporangium rufum]